MGNEAGNRTQRRLNRVPQRRNLQDRKIVWKTFRRWKGAKRNWQQVKEGPRKPLFGIGSAAPSYQRKTNANKKGHRLNRISCAVKKYWERVLRESNEANLRSICSFYERAQKKQSKSKRGRRNRKTYQSYRPVNRRSQQKNWLNPKTQRWRAAKGYSR